MVIQLLEFIKADNAEVTDQELEFLSTVADTFNIEKEEYDSIREFVLNDKKLELSAHYLFVDDSKTGRGLPEGSKHIWRENLGGQIRVIHILSTNLYFVKYIGHYIFYICFHAKQKQVDKTV